MTVYLRTRKMGSPDGYDRWCFVDAGDNYHGLSREQIESVFHTADLFVDHMRACEWGEEASHARLTVQVDGEPGFTQMLMENKAAAGEPLMHYDHYYSVGLNIGTGASSAPSAGRKWHPIFDPVLPDLFGNGLPPANAPFTTIMSWQAHKPVEFGGRVYGQKDVEFEKFVTLPERTTARLELAVSGNVPTERLRMAGWNLRDSLSATATYDGWLSYIRQSKGEFSVCKNVFVATNSGAFSDRSAAYLASGRPVVMQETGFSAHLPCGRGLFAVRDVEEAASAIEEISGNYKKHSRWARELAYEYLDAKNVLGRFLNELGI